MDSEGLSSVEGVTSGGERFRVPATISVMRALVTPRCYRSPATLFWIACCLLTEASLVLYYLCDSTSVRWFFTAQFVFWRLCYNVGIGAMLHWQSNGRMFEKWVIRKLKEGWFRSLVDASVTFKDPAEPAFSVQKFPLSFSAWMVFRTVVNVILASDLLSYFLLVWVHWAPADATPSQLVGLIGNHFATASALDLVQDTVGIALIAFALWSKSDAHRVIGDYAWYWGDFFFLLNQELHFDGIFEMFPHPMYTVGYAFMYGFSLLSRSHTVFYWSVFGHMCQIVFLAVVENPHIDKTYKASFVDDEASKEQEVLYDEEQGYFEKRELVLLRNLSLLRGSDVLLLVILMYNVIIFATASSWSTVALQYAGWRALLTFGLGLALRDQSMNQSWSHRFGSPRRAFDSWKALYNTVVTTTNFCFLLCALWFAYESVPLALSFEDEWRSTLMIVGLLLVGINVWASLSVYEVVGDYGFFYGDFFIENCPRRLRYSGVYRYLNNPDSVLGCAWYYGLACITYSFELLVLAMATHVCIKGFELFVEAPHMRRKYGNEIRRESGAKRALAARARKVTSELGERRRRLRAEYDRAMQRLRDEATRRTREFEEVSRKMK